jgi:DNA-binding beta-propeller fold protein YncE
VGNAIGVSPDGSTVFVTGQSVGSAGHSMYATLSYDAATGTKRFVSRYTGPDGIDDEARALAVSPGGAEVYVTGTSYGLMTGPDFATVAYDVSTGDQLWARRYNGTGDADDQAKTMATSPDGSAIFVAGPSFGSSTGFDYATVAYSAI